MKTNIIIYDGECGFCNKAVMFMAKRDIQNKFIFVSSVSEIGSDFLIEKDLLELSKTSIILKINSLVFTEGIAIKKISKELKFNFILKFLISTANLKILNFAYQITSRNRLYLSNKQCEIPSTEIMSKFIL